MEIGNIYGVNSSSLLNCVAGNYEISSNITLSLKKCFNEDDIGIDFPIIVKYLGNGIFEEMETGKKLLISTNSVFAPNMVYEYAVLKDTLALIYNNPLIVNTNEICEWSKISSKFVDEYSLKSNEIPTLLTKLEETSRKSFHDSLLELGWLSYQEYSMRTEKVHAKVKEFENKN